MRKNAFTLIELLAVIVILAIIALIAVPIVLGIINDSKISSEQESINLYVDQVQKIITKQNLKTKYSPNICDIQEDGNIKCNGDINNTKESLEISIKGNKPNGGTIVFENGKITNIYDLVINGKKYNYDSTRKLKLLEIPEIPGLYDKEYKLLASWDELKDYGLNTENGELKQGIKDIINNNSNLSNSSMLIISNDITKIGMYAFKNCSQLESIIIPESVKSVNAYAFYECTGLTNIMIPKNLNSIGALAFGNCSNLKLIKVDPKSSIFEDRGSNAIISKSNNELVLGCQNTIIPDSVTKIGNYAFWGCKNLINIIVPATVTSINGMAFQYCSKLSSVIFEKGSKLTSIGTYAFTDCKSLMEIIIPSTVTSIGNYAFMGCSNILSVIFEKNSQLVSIGNHAFYNCISLTNITIPSTVTSISIYAFLSCSKLSSVIFENTEGWYIYDTNTETVGTEIDVTNEYINPTNLRSTYHKKYWKRNV